MIKICINSDVTDAGKTREGLSIDLNKALNEGVVKDSGTEPEYNNIEDPRQIRGRVADCFMAIDERNSVMHRAASSHVNPSSVDETKNE